MAKACRIFFIFLVSGIFACLLLPNISVAEDKSNIPSGQNIQKLPVTPDDPKLSDGHVYPNWGPVCQKYTYSVIYSDNKGRAPAYVKMYFNGEMLDLEKEKPDDNDYARGVKYIYKFVPTKTGSNFFFFEASNGLGKTRSNIIDSPDNGPVLFKNAFDQNEIAVIDAEKRTKILSYDLKDEWVGGVALSDDGNYLAVKTHKRIYLFDTAKPQEPIWSYEGAHETPGDVKGGVGISGDGTRIIASIGGKAILFNNQTNKPQWVYQGTGNQAYNVAISRDGKYMAMGTAGSVSSTAQGYESSATTNLLILWSEESNVPLWQYHTDGNFHDVSLSNDGSFITGATGCPDRRFYLFSKDSNKPIVRSEMLTQDSPVHRAKISGDGQYAAVGSESNGGAVFLFSKNSNSPSWKFSTPGGSSVRALNFTSDGAHIGAATFLGDVYIFSRNSNIPVSHWKVDTSLGGIDIAEDGSFVATGGTDNKLHIFSKELTKSFNVDFNEYVEEIDISANGKYIAAGTGGSVYFFEAFDDSTKTAGECAEIKEPVAESTENKNFPPNNSTMEKKRIDNIALTKKQWQGTLFGFGFLGSLIVLAGYFIAVKFDLFSKLKPNQDKESSGIETKNSKEPLKINKKIVILLISVVLIFLVLVIISMILNVRNKQEADGITSGEIQATGCGNTICEPNLGETKLNCPKDCSM